MLRADSMMVSNSQSGVALESIDRLNFGYIPARRRVWPPLSAALDEHGGAHWTGAVVLVLRKGN